MKPHDPAILDKVRQWLAYADEDLRLARHGFSMPETPPYRLIAHHAQQCAEKHLKAYLVFHGLDFPYTHNLRRLLDLCAGEAGQADWAEQLRDAEALTPYAVTARYPGVDDEVTEFETRRALEIASRVGGNRKTRPSPGGIRDSRGEPRVSATIPQLIIYSQKGRHDIRLEAEQQ